LAFAIFTDWAIGVRVLTVVAAVLVGIFQGAFFSAVSSAGVAWRRIILYGSLRSRAETLQHDLARERKYVEDLAQQLGQYQPPYLAIYDALKTSAGGYMILIQKGPTLKLATGQRVELRP
jgi:hypothetical protein